jgi:uncharacterized protein (TIGR00725 family)
MPRRIVAVIGTARANPAERRAAEKVGKLLAEAGVIVLTGGLTGVMEAASRGAKAAGGLVVGIVPRGSGNRFLDVRISTHMGDARNAIIANTASAFVAVGGSHGTLSEIAYALKRKKPVVGLGSWKIPGVRRARSPEEAVRLALRSKG